MRPAKSVEGLVEGVVYHNANFQPYVLTHCIVCGKPKVSLLYKGAVQYPKCVYCANHTAEKREMMRRLFKGTPKTPGQIEKLRAASTGNKNCVGKHLTDATKAKLSALYKGRKLSEETKHKMSVAVKARPPHSLEQRRKNSLALKGRRPSDKCMQASLLARQTRVVPEAEREARRQRMLKAWQDPIFRERTLRAHRQACDRPEVRLKFKENSLKMWANRTEEERDAIIQSVIQRSNRKPNSKELRLGELINIACPNEYRYTGDGSFVIGGKIPDFTNVNGHKKVVELFGDYFHRDELFKGKVKIKWHRTEQGCKETYAKYGFDCLVIWEKELKNQSPEQIISRVREFTYQ